MSEEINFTPIGKIGEFGLIEKLTDTLDSVQPNTIKAVGDDAAVIKTGDDCMVVTTDLLVEGIHFDLSYSPLKHLGYKAVMVNLSDIYAMNAKPEQITVSFALSNRISVEAAEELYQGIKDACLDFDVDIVGGDTTSSLKGLMISITAIGRAKEGDLCYRNGAKVGDLICVSGDLGAAYLGLQLLEREKQIFMSTPDFQPDFEDQKYLIQRQLKPIARQDIIESMAKLNINPSSMIDISDGLASDVMHIVKQSDVGAHIHEDWVPMHDEAKLMAIKFQLDPITCALNGGEDYELLFTLSPDQEPLLDGLQDCTVIGEILPRGEGLKLISSSGKMHDISAQGWSHFS